MDKLVLTSASVVTESDLAAAQLGSRFGRLDLLSRLSTFAVESLHLNFDRLGRDRIGICLAARAGSLSTDVEYWKGWGTAGGPSPTLFAYTLPSAALGEIAIRYRLTGPNLALVGSDTMVLAEAGDMIRQGEAEGCVCVSCNVVTLGAAEIIQAPPAAVACALFLERSGDGLCLFPEMDRDMESVCAAVRARKSRSLINHTP